MSSHDKKPGKYTRSKTNPGESIEDMLSDFRVPRVNAVFLGLSNLEKIHYRVLVSPIDRSHSFLKIEMKSIGRRVFSC